MPVLMGWMSWISFSVQPSTPADIAENRGTGVADVLVVERAQLVERIELLDLLLVIAADVHLQLADIADIEILPQVLARNLLVILRAQDLHELAAERAVEVDVAEHAPRIMAADGHAGDAAPAVALEAVLFRFALGVDRGVIGAVDKRLEGILGEVVVRGADVGVLEPVGHQHQRRGVVIAVVVRVHHDVHAELLGEVEHLLLHIADDERDVADPGLLQLADLPLDEQLTLDAQQCLRLFIRERGKACAHARRHNHGVFYTVGRKRLLARVRDTSAREQPRLRQRRHGLVDLAERHVRLRGQRAA